MMVFIELLVKIKCRKKINSSRKLLKLDLADSNKKFFFELLRSK